MHRIYLMMRRRRSAYQRLNDRMLLQYDVCRANNNKHIMGIPTTSTNKKITYMGSGVDLGGGLGFHLPAFMRRNVPRE